MGRKPSKRILLKLSGGVLDWNNKKAGLKFLKNIAKEIKDLIKSDYKFVIIIGGGNIWRYRDNIDLKLDRVDSDHIGMLATIVNGLIIKDVFNSEGIKTKALTALSAPAVMDLYNPSHANKLLELCDVLVCSGGTGKPFVTTDTAAAMRAIDLKCGLIAKATNVDFVYDKDPNKFKDARPFKALTYKEVIEKKLGIMDLNAISLCMTNKIPIIIFNLYKKENLKKAILGKRIGTIIN